MNPRFPYQNELQIGESLFPYQMILEHLEPLLTNERKARIDDVLSKRTYGVVPVLEDIYDRGNTSAVMRSAESMGFQPFHIIEKGEKFKESARVTSGADKWLDIVKWKQTEDCLNDLKSRGYQICVTALEDSVPLSEVDFSRPTALLFGNEKEGASAEAKELADQCVLIPMQGFTQSFNISVAAALSFYHAHLGRTRSFGQSGDLKDEEKEILRALFYAKTLTQAEEILKNIS